MNIATNLFWNVVAKTPDEPLSVPNTWEVTNPLKGPEKADKPRFNPWEGDPDKKEEPLEEPSKGEKPAEGKNPVNEREPVNVEEPADDTPSVEETGETTDSYEEAKPSGVPSPFKPRVIPTSVLFSNDSDIETDPEEEKFYESGVLYKASDDVFVMHFDDATATSDALQMVADALAEAELDPAKMHSYLVGYNGKASLDDEYIASTKKDQPQKSVSAESESAGDEPVEQAEEEPQEPGFKFKTVRGYGFTGTEEHSYPSQSIFVSARPFTGAAGRGENSWLSKDLDKVVENASQYLCEVSPETPFDNLTSRIELWRERHTSDNDNFVLDDLSYETSEDGKTLSVTVIPKNNTHISDVLSNLDTLGKELEHVPCTADGTIEVDMHVPAWKDGSPHLADLKEAISATFGSSGSAVKVNFVKDEELHIKVAMGVETIEKGALKGTVYATPRILESWSAVENFQSDYEELVGKILGMHKKIEDYKPVVVYERPYGFGSMPEQNAAQEFIYRLSLSLKQTRSVRSHKTVQAILTSLAATKPDLFESTYVQDLAGAIGKIGVVTTEAGQQLAEDMPDIFTPERLAGIKKADDIEGYAQTMMQDIETANPELLKKSLPQLINALKRLDGGPKAILERLTIAKPELLPQTVPALVNAGMLEDEIVAILEKWVSANPDQLSEITSELIGAAVTEKGIDKGVAKVLRQIAVKDSALLPDILPVLVTTKELGSDVAVALEELLSSDPDALETIQSSLEDAVRTNKDMRDVAKILELEINYGEPEDNSERPGSKPQAEPVKDATQKGAPASNYLMPKDKIIPYIVHSKQARDGVTLPDDGIPEIKRPYFTVMMVPKGLALPEGETFKTFQDLIDARDASKGSTPAQKKEADDMLYQLYLRLRNEEMWNEVVSGNVDI